MIGVVSDTHGLVRPELLDALAGCDAIVHAGDVGGDEVLEALRAIAPVTVVRGNNDRDMPQLPEEATLVVRGRRIHVVHDIADLSIDAPAAKVDLVVYGHSHRPRLEERAGVTYLNPGSAGPRRFNLPIAAARVRLTDGGLEPELVELVRPKRK